MDKPGVVYALYNKAWSDWVKIGSVYGAGPQAISALRSRLSNYNIGDPFKDYEIIGHDHAACALSAEDLARQILLVRHQTGLGEWIKCDKEAAIAALQKACSICRLRPVARTRAIEEALEEELAGYDSPAGRAEVFIVANAPYVEKVFGGDRYGKSQRPRFGNFYLDRSEALAVAKRLNNLANGRSEWSVYTASVTISDVQS